MEHGMNWMLYQIERRARERDERDHAWRMRFEIARALRESTERCRELAAQTSRSSLAGAFVPIADRIRRIVGRPTTCDCGAPAA